MEVVAEMDGGKLLDLTCRAQQNNAMAGGAMAQGLLGLASLFGGGDMQIDVSRLNYQTVSQSGNSATVRVSGVVRTVMGLSASEQMTDMTVQMLMEDGKWKVCG
jgi:hypothetical protein